MVGGIRNTDATNLFETYMYGTKNRTRKMFKFYKNCEDCLDDPLFTGFTFDIDYLHSPLFYMGSSYEEAYEQSNPTALSSAIEENLENVYKFSIKGNPESYEIFTSATKDTIVEGAFAGYGLEDKHYMDNVTYGAVDYIYMVDKVYDSVISDDIGVADIGNGTPDSSKYDQQNEALEKNGIDGDGGDSEEIDEIGKKIRELYAEKDRHKAEHEANKADYELKETQYKAIYKQYTDTKKDFDEIKDGVDEDFNDIDIELKDIQATAEKILNNLKSGGFNSAQLSAEISEAYAKLESIFSSEGEYADIDITKFTESSIFTDEENSLSNDEKSRYDSGGNKDTYRKCWAIIKTKINKYTIKDSQKSQMDSLQSEINSFEQTLFGDGGSIGNPQQGSLLYDKNEAKSKMNNDEFTRIQNEILILTDTKDHYEDLKKFNEYESQKNQVTINKRELPSSDNHQEQSNRQLKKAPQTVYDMIGFINGMKRMTTEYPYIMQSVEGLDEAYRKYFSMKDPYQGSGDEKITINCLESIDLRVSSMFNRYLNAAYDHMYRRERVPVNLRRFNCSIYVHDIRNFRNSMANRDNKFREFKDGDNAISKMVELALNYYSAIEFKFYDCEIVAEETGSIFDSISNENAGDMKKTKFSFTYGYCVVNFLPFGDMQNHFKTNQNGDELGKPEDYMERKYINETAPIYNRNDLGMSRLANNFADFSMSQNINENFKKNPIRTFVGISASTGYPVADIMRAFNLEDIHATTRHPNGLGKVDGFDDTGTIRMFESYKVEGSTPNEIIGNYSDLGDAVEEPDGGTIKPYNGETIDVSYSMIGIGGDLGDAVEEPENGTIKQYEGETIDVSYEMSGIGGDLGDVVEEPDGGTIKTYNGEKVDVSYSTNGIHKDLGDAVEEPENGTIKQYGGEKIDLSYKTFGTYVDLGDAVEEPDGGTIKQYEGEKIDLSYSTYGTYTDLGDAVEEGDGGTIKQYEGEKVDLSEGGNKICDNLGNMN